MFYKYMTLNTSNRIVLSIEITIHIFKFDYTHEMVKTRLLVESKLNQKRAIQRTL